VGSRTSALAQRQTDIVVEALRAILPGVEIVKRRLDTEGDRRRDLPLEELGGQGVFVKDIEQRLLDREIDIAVHSLKDMPAETSPALAIAAVLPRADVRDVLVAREGASLAELPAGARIGTDSRRRVVQLLALRPDLRPESIRGNVDTRLRKVQEGDYDGVVLAAAGLERLGRLAEATQVFSLDEMLPAIGQGVLAVQCRSSDRETLSLLSAVDDRPTRVAMTAERALLQRLGAGCRLPVGGYATLQGVRLLLRGMLADDSGQIYREQITGPAAEAEWLGEDLADRLSRLAGVTQ
jgi:hydroxymethylbilane synthase